jgi:SNF2 family DNA or RNA helicase
MFLNSALYDHLSKNFGFKESRAGLSLVKEAAVIDVFHNIEQKYLEISIKEDLLYSVIIKYKNAFAIELFSCTCTTQNCKHVSAAIQYLVTKSDSDLNIQRAITSNSQQVVFKPEVLKEYLFEESPPNTFRLLPSNYSGDFSNLIASAKTPFTENIREVLSEAFIFPEDIIQVTLTIQTLFSKSYAAIVTLDFGQNKIHCNSCSSPTQRLCPHQSFALVNVIGKEVIKNIEGYRYNTLAARFSKEKDIAVAKFNRLFKISLKDGVVSPQKLVKNYLDKTSINLVTALVNNFSNQKENKLYEVLSRQGNAQSENSNNAFVWVHADFTTKSPMLIEAKIAKNDKITSAVAEVNYPSHFTFQQNEFYHQINSLFKKYKSTTQLLNQAILATLKSNISLLQSINCYVAYGTLLNKNTLTSIYFDSTTAYVQFVLKEDDYFFKLQRQLCLDEVIINSSFQIFEHFILIDKNAFLYKSIHDHLALVIDDLNEILIEKEDKQQLIDLLIAIKQHHNVDLPPDFDINIEQCNNSTKEIFIIESGDTLFFKPQLRYNDYVFFNAINQDFLSQEGQDLIYKINEEEKDELIKFICESHPSFTASYSQTSTFFINIGDFIKEAWFLQFFEKCKTQDITLFGQENLKNFRFNTNVAYVKTSISSGIDWFDVAVEISYGDQKVSTKAWIDAVKRNEKVIKLDDGTFGLIPEQWFEKLKRIATISDLSEEKLTISKFKFGVVDELFEQLSDDRLYLDIQAKVHKLTDNKSLKRHQLPGDILATLRPYQHEGYQWLKSLDEANFGGCLADDMGLGKTLQVICLLVDQAKKGLGTSIVIAPRSLLFNWAAEIDKFAPSLSYMLYHGPYRRDSRKSFSKHNIIITTYDTTTIDIEFIKELKFNYAILDESQAIKNPNSKRYKAMRLISARNRLVMTGTPIENNTFDLYAQFSFINPGIFGSQLSFKERFSNPVDKQVDQDAIIMMRKIISPFFLRRTKEVVAQDLPEKTENIIYCEMDAPQRAMYEELKARIKQDIEGSITTLGLNKSKFKILEGLLRLRQLCNAPALLDKSIPDHKKSSVKINTLIDILKNDLGPHNALVFSQFTSMLDLIRKELDKEGIKYSYLDGSTRDRKGAVDSFQNNDEVRVFLISLKAGNTGLNLVKADYVYIVDPWWNPAVEAQAIDRTHRIGQDKHIFAYKMICKNTIEEKIILLQQKKKKIAQDIISSDENIFKSLSKEELMDLFL